MEIFGSRYVKIRLTTATEHHHHVGKLTRIRVEPIMSNFCLALLAASCILAGLLIYHTWPFSRPALLIPLAWWGMYLVNRWRVVNPALGLIDAAAEKPGFYPCRPSGPRPKRPSPRPPRPRPPRRRCSRNRCPSPWPRPIRISISRKEPRR